MNTPVYENEATGGAERASGDCASVRALIERQIDCRPEAVALVFYDRNITYKELGNKANQLANELIGLGVGPDKLVGICLEPSIETIIALLAVFKAGGAYVTVDPEYPARRLALILGDAQPAVIITRTALLGTLPPEVRKRALCVDAVAWNSGEGARNPENNTGPDDLAYVIYTSGSTGQPKGVAMPQGPLCNLLEWQMTHWTLPAAARTVQFASLNFDVAFQDIFSTLCSGGTLFLISPEIRRDSSALLLLMSEQEIERIFLPFIALQQLANAFEAEGVLPAALRDVITAGEQLQITPQIRQFFKKLPGCALHNQYGPAETHVVTAFTLSGDPAVWPLLPPIGRPVARARVYILDDRGNPVPGGEIGEICVGGDALARGYLNLPGLTAERFLPDPLSREPGARYYKTGDLGRLLPEGDIQFLGRGDHQTKIRGVRVELGEVEAAMTGHPAVLQSAVCVKEGTAGEKRLVGYYVASAPIEGREMRGFLASRLPPQLVPTALVPVKEIPLTATGKVDRITLASLDENAAEPRSGEEVDAATLPPNELQARLVAIWEDVLGLRPIGVHDSFFEIGGDSLLAVQVCATIKKEFGRTLSVARLYNAPTVEQLAAVVRKGHSPKSGLNVIRAAGTRPPFFCAPGLIDLAHELGPDQPVYGFDLTVRELPDRKTVVQQIAERWITELRGVQPHGPYYLGGHSFGGVVAVEAAAQLTDQGERIALLALIDPDPPKLSPIAAAMWVAALPIHLMRRIRDIPPGERLAYILRRAGMRKSRIASKFQALNHFAEMDSETKLEALTADYHARKYPGRITLFCAQGGERGFGPAPSLHWKSVAAETVVHGVPGDHVGLVRQPHVKTLAKLLRSCIEETV